ncbi:MAG: hypothetical protein CM15mP55_4000 [Hyphomicrobiales bacterium]|nr:MAG: hypothetical protein CM15mP55_4000 [Hyphomicrobiales bacterium]
MSDALREQFALHEEFEITVAQTAPRRLSWWRKLNLPYFCWMSACPTKTARNVQNFRRQKVLAPIIMLAGAATEATRFWGWMRRNDYVTKPFRFGVLLPAHSRHLRQFETSAPAF